MSSGATADLNENLRTLSNVLNKDDGIVNTSSANRFLNRPEDIEGQYEEYAQTHLIQPDISRSIENLREKLSDPDEDRSIPGYIVGPYGYGKTSTAGKIWYQLEKEANYIATPPIYFDELQSIVDAVYGWMRYRIKTRSPQLVDVVEDAYEAQVTDNLGDLLETTDLENKDAVQQELETLREKGALDIEFTVRNVLDFLSECNSIAKDAGFDGLVVIADELQQFVSNHSSDKEAYAQLRDIAKSIALGLNEEDGLGLLFTMDDGLHGDLNINADDVLARLSEQNVTINLQNVYERSFPDRLWESLSERYGFEDSRYEVISDDALDAIGQICERGPPMSNGPRTVVDLLTIAIDHYLDEGEVFDALALADKYYNGVVRYKSDRIKKAITEGINTEEVQTDDHRNVIKLCGVFPRGVSDDLFKKYGLFEAKDEIKQSLHGFILITHEEGRTLKDLEREDEDRGVKDELFTQFYQKYDTTDVYYDNAAEVFRQEVLKQELFPSKRGTSLSSWTTKHDFEPETGNVYSAVFHGSFNGQAYPKRNLQIRVGPNDNVVTTTGSTQPDIDFTMGFVLDMDENAESYISHPSTDEVLLHLNLRTEFDTLPSNIALLENYMSPEDVTPHLLLALYHYIEDWEGQSINPSQEDQLDFIKDQIINQSIQQLFGPPINSDSFFEMENPRRTVEPTKVVSKIFDRVIEDIYPDYETLFVSDNYSRFLEEYEALLLSPKLDLRISQKRGSTPIETTKDEFVEGLGLASAATAETHLEKQFSALSTIDDWTGSGEDTIRVSLSLHPLEKRLLDTLDESDDGEVTYSEAYRIGQEDGHRRDEVEWAVKLLEARDYVDAEESAGQIKLIDIAINPSAILDNVEQLRETIQRVNDFDGDWIDRNNLPERLDEIEDDVTSATEEDVELLDGCNARIQEIRGVLKTKLAELHTRYQERCRSLNDDFAGLQNKSKPQDLAGAPENMGVPFEMHLSDFREELNADVNQIRNEAETKHTELSQQIQDLDDRSSINEVEQLKETCETADGTLSALQTDWAEIEDQAQDYRDWCDFAKEMSKTRKEMVRYEKNHDGTTEADRLITNLNEILGEIQTEFQNDTEGAIKDAGMYREQFVDIRDEFEEITEGDRENFTYRKNVLDNTITEATEERGRIRQTLDPNDPESSRKNIKHDFVEAIASNRGGIDSIIENIESVRTKLEYSEYLNMVPDAPEQSPAEIRGALEEVKSELKELQKQCEQVSVNNDIQLPEAEDRADNFPATERRLYLSVNTETVDVGARIQEMRASVSDIEDTVTQWRQTTEDVPENLEYLHDVIEYDGDTNLEQILMDLKEEDGDVEMSMVFEDLRRLFENNHVSITVSSEHRR